MDEHDLISSPDDEWDAPSHRMGSITIWRTREGRTMSIHAMDSSHLLNATRLMQKNLREADSRISEVARQIAENPEDNSLHEQFDDARNKQSRLSEIVRALVGESARRDSLHAAAKARLEEARALRGPEIEEEDPWRP